MNQLKNISFRLPANEIAQRTAFEHLSNLLTERTLASRETDYFPKVSFDSTNSQAASILTSVRHEIVLHPNVDISNTRDGIIRMPIVEVCDRFHGCILEMDHAGVNLSPATVGVGKLKEMLSELGAVTNLYAYPGGEPWFFVVPATEQEQRDNISDFSRVRRPKFELVADVRGPTPLIQIDCVTRLTREEIEKRLPKPFGIGLAGLDQYFRSVFVEHPWSGFELRFDFRYATAELNEWSTGQWLITQGERYNQSVERRLETFQR